MNKIVLIDGNNLIFRSFYATAYTGNLMTNSSGFPTNAIYGLANMLLKIEKEEKPNYVLVAFDKGKTFRHDLHDDYKDGRDETPLDLKKQFDVAKKMVNLMGYTVMEIDNYEADDIIGTYAEKLKQDSENDIIIVSSDKDLLQLIDKGVSVKLLKKTAHEYINADNFRDFYPFNPSSIVDLKALMGDQSDNIKGVAGVGEKTALKLLEEYQKIENIYSNIENIKGKLKDKLIDGKEDAYNSYNLATIVRNVNMPVSLNLISKRNVSSNLKELLDELEFTSLKNKFTFEEEEFNVEVSEVSSLNIDKDFSIYMIMPEENYHYTDVLAYMVYDGHKYYYLNNLDKLTYNQKVFTYDSKKLYVKNADFNISFDLEIALYTLNKDIRDDISYYMNIKGQDVVLVADEFGKGSKFKMPPKETILKNAAKRAKFIYEESLKHIDLMEDEIFKLEMKLAKTLASMEIKGIKVDGEYLTNIGQDIDQKIINLTSQIYLLAKEEFNISSPKQLGDILFNKMGLKYPRKVKNNNYSTSREILDKIINDHDIIPLIITYRTLSKLKSTYVDSLLTEIHDGYIHTTYNQCLTRTGRLSSSSPNLQNIPEHNEYGRLIKKAFIAEDGYEFLSCDYSQIELRVFAAMSKDNNMINAFKEGYDIHKKTAAEIFKKDINEVTANERYMAKAVNFGIIYGISSFGLSEDLAIDISSAKTFIDNYLKTFPSLKIFMDKLIKDAKENGYVETLMKRKRYIPELFSNNFMVRKQGERMALNTPIQGTAADILKIAMNNIYDKLKEKSLKSYIVLQVHDELILNVHKSEKEEVLKIVEREMENAFKFDVPLKVESSFGINLFSI